MESIPQTVTKEQMLLGGPCLDGYAYRADAYCVDCGRSIIEAGPDTLTESQAADSEVTPIPIFFGESDYPQHCGNCGEYPYGSKDGGA